MSFLSTYKSDFSKNIKLALPIMAGQLGQITVNVADTLMVGRLGAAPLAAVSLAGAIIVPFLVVGMGISFALPPLVSEADGANKPHRISQFFKHSLIANLIYSVLAFSIIRFGLPLINYMGQDPEVVKLAMPYLVLSAWAMIPFMLFQTVRCYSDGMSETIPPMIAMLVGNFLNVIFNYIFIFGKFGMPALGVEGAALGTLLARSLMFLMLIGILFYWKDLWTHIKNAKYWIYQKRIFVRIANLGVPSSLQMFFEVSAFAGAALIMGMVSKNAQAAHQVAINLASITFLICAGFGMAATVRVGNNLGRQDPAGMMRAGVSAILQVSLFMAVTATIFILFRDFLPSLYINDETVLSIASLLMIFAAVFQIPDGVQVVALGALRGIQDVKVPTVITFISYWIFGLPISYLAAFNLKLGPIGVWLGLTIGLAISATLLTNRFLRKLKNF